MANRATVKPNFQTGDTPTQAQFYELIDSTYFAADDGVPELVSNKATTMTGNTTSNVVFLTAKAIYDWAVALFQPLLVSGTNIKTINGSSVLGSGNLVISGGTPFDPSVDNIGVITSNTSPIANLDPITVFAGKVKGQLESEIISFGGSNIIGFPFYVPNALRVTNITKDPRISTITYSLNGGAFGVMTYPTDFAENDSLEFRVVYANENIRTGSFNLYYTIL